MASQSGSPPRTATTPRGEALPVTVWPTAAPMRLQAEIEA